MGSTKVIKTRDVVFHKDKEVSTSDGTAEGSCADSVGETGVAVGDPDDMKGASEFLDVPKPANPVGAADPLGVPDPQRPVRPRQDTKKTWKLWEGADVSSAAVPKSYRQAMQGPHAEEWRVVVSGEFQSWKDKDVYEVQCCVPDMEVLPSITLLSEKMDKWGVPVHKKARCVVRGDMQSELPNDGPTHSSPVAQFLTFHIMGAKAAITGCKLQQMDVCTAFLHAPIE
jgi:hypothetical protein